MTRRLARWGLPVLALLLVGIYAAGRRPPAAPVTETRFLMDTLVTVTLWGEAGSHADADLAAAFDALAAVDREMARVPDSPLWALDVAGGGEVSPALGEVIDAALDWSRRSRGAFDPTVAALIDLWDVAAGPHPPPAPEALSAARAQVGWQKVSWRPESRTVELGGTALDLGGIAKGYALDRAADALRSRGCRNFIVNAGGDLFVAGAKGDVPWKVGIQHPREPDAFLRVVAPAEGAIVTSGDYERAYLWEGKRIHHILDPRTGRPGRRCRSVTVWALNGIDADALATAVFVLGADEGLALIEAEPGAQGLVVDAEGRVRETPGFGRVAPEAGER